MTNKGRISTLLLLGALGCEPGLGHVELTVAGKGRVRSNPEGLACTAGGNACSAELGHSYTLVAEPDAGARFDHWEGDEVCVTAARPTVIVGDAPEHGVSCTAVFVDDTSTAAQ
jgi:hypothetical protein